MSYETKTIKDLLIEHPFFKAMSPSDVHLISGCGLIRRFLPEEYLAHEGQSADHFFLIRHGLISVELHWPGRGRKIIETLGPGEIAGWSWIFPPYRWTFDLRAVEASVVIALDGQCLRQKCDDDPSLGYRLMKAFAGLMTKRLKDNRLQLMDLYGRAEG